MEIRGYGDANPVLYQILKHMMINGNFWKIN